MKKIIAELEQKIGERDLNISVLIGQIEELRHDLEFARSQRDIYEGEFSGLKAIVEGVVYKQAYLAPYAERFDAVGKALTDKISADDEAWKAEVKAAHSDLAMEELRKDQANQSADKLGASWKSTERDLVDLRKKNSTLTGQVTRWRNRARKAEGRRAS